MRKTIFSIMFAIVISMMIGSCTNSTPAVVVDDVDSTAVDTTVVDSTVVDTVAVDTVMVVDSTVVE